MKSTRFERLSDYVKIVCRKCGSEDINLHGETCHECGSTIESHCNSCNAKYKYHDFKKGIVEYDDEGNEISFEVI